MGLTENKASYGPVGLRDRFSRWQTNLVSQTSFQEWADRVPLVRKIARKDGERLFDLVAGFVYSQTLFACVELDLLHKLHAFPRDVDALALTCKIAPHRMKILCQSAVSIGLLRKGKDGRYHLARLGAAVLGVPGLLEMIRHHQVLYRDLENPVALLREQMKPQLAEFWPYVLGEGGASADKSSFDRYSDLMAKSQTMVAKDTLKLVPLHGSQLLMDVGGGHGAFLREVKRTYPDLEVRLFDLPQVVAEVVEFPCVGGSFLEPLPKGADTISLIRVLYDHKDVTVSLLLRNVFDALPSGGRLVISEPMSGGDSPDRATDSYFALYTLAMGTGQVRSQSEIEDMLVQTGFSAVEKPKSARAFVTSVVTAIKP